MPIAGGFPLAAFNVLDKIVNGCNGCTSCDVEQPPEGIEFRANNIFVKQLLIARKDTLIPQHAHAYDHMSMLATGAVRVWKDGVLDRDYQAPAGIFIGAGIKHTFQSLEDATIIYCVHAVAGDGDVEIAAEHQFTRAG